MGLDSHIEHPITLGVIEHQADECPAIHKEQADKVVPALETAAEAEQLPDTLVFSSKDHKGAFVAGGTKEEVAGGLPELPIHEVRLHDASTDTVAQQLLRDPSSLQSDEDARRDFLTHVEGRYPESFPNKNEGPVPSGAELAGFIASKHE